MALETILVSECHLGLFHNSWAARVGGWAGGMGTGGDNLVCHGVCCTWKPSGLWVGLTKFLMCLDGVCQKPNVRLSLEPVLERARTPCWPGWNSYTPCQGLGKSCVKPATLGSSAWEPPLRRTITG